MSCISSFCFELASYDRYCSLLEMVVNSLHFKLFITLNQSCYWSMTDIFVLSLGAIPQNLLSQITILASKQLVSSVYYIICFYFLQNIINCGLLWIFELLHTKRNIGSTWYLENIKQVFSHKAMPEWCSVVFWLNNIDTSLIIIL